MNNLEKHEKIYQMIIISNILKKMKCYEKGIQAYCTESSTSVHA